MVMSSCQQNELRECRGVVTGITDSTLTAVIDGDTVQFEARDMRLTNGVMMPSDSVKINYIGRLEGQAKALTGELIPKTRIVDAVYNPEKELETRDKENR